VKLSSLAIYFVTGGLVTTIIVILEQVGNRTLSGLATLVPVFTLVGYFFIGQNKGGQAVAQHARFVLVGTLVSWVPYMLVVASLAPRFGPNRAIVAGLAVFFVLALSYIFVATRVGFTG